MFFEVDSVYKSVKCFEAKYGGIRLSMTDV